MNFRLLRHLYYFSVVAEEEHFGRAAARLGISQPPLSQQIMVLEQHLGARLFDRSKKGATLTDIGTAILPAVKKLLAESSQLEFTLLNIKAGRPQAIRIGAIETAIVNVLPPLLADLRKRYPDLAIKLLSMDSADALRALDDDTIDLAFLRADKAGESIAIRPVVREPLYLAVHESHQYARRRHIQLSTLHDEPLIHCPRRVSPIYFDSIMQACRDAGLRPRIIQEVESVASQIGFVAYSVGSALVPRSARQSAPPSVRFIALRPVAPITTLALALHKFRSRPLIRSIADIWKVAESS